MAFLALSSADSTYSDSIIPLPRLLSTNQSASERASRDKKGMRNLIDQNLSWNLSFWEINKFRSSQRLPHIRFCRPQWMNLFHFLLSLALISISIKSVLINCWGGITVCQCVSAFNYYHLLCLLSRILELAHTRSSWEQNVEKKANYKYLIEFLSHVSSVEREEKKFNNWLTIIWILGSYRNREREKESERVKMLIRNEFLSSNNLISCKCLLMKFFKCLHSK